MKQISIRFYYATVALVALSALAYVGRNDAAGALAEVTQPIEAATKTVIDSTEAAREFGAYLPGSFK